VRVFLFDIVKPAVRREMSLPTEQRGVLENLHLLTEGDLGLEAVWVRFDRFCQTPRASGNEEKARAMVREFAQYRNLKLEEDDAGNILFMVPASFDYENVPGIVFQGHLDMVPQGEPDPAIHGVKPQVVTDENGRAWVRSSDKTTLGADNGIGVTLMMALADERIPHGPLAFLFTNREEVGLVSAREMTLTNKFERYKYLFNLDTEEEGEATISSAGAADTIITYETKSEPVGDRQIVTVQLGGLMGGHSGMVIGEGRLNAAVVMAGLLENLRFRFGKKQVNLVGLTSGTARNAIPSEATAILALDGVAQECLEEELSKYNELVLSQPHQTAEENMTITMNYLNGEGHNMLDNESTTQVIQLLRTLPNGLVKWSEEIQGFPQTSTNIGVVDLEEDQPLRVQIMSRSSVVKELRAVRHLISLTAEKAGLVGIEQPPEYSGWAPVIDSEINRLTALAWKQISGQLLKLRYTHGGLECGVLMGRYPHLQAISIGPDIKGAHTVEERVSVESVKKYYRLLKEIITQVASYR
jgi:dipeptidase D